MAATHLLSMLEEAGIAYELLPHAHAETAAAEADALGVAPAQVAKTLVVATPSGFVRAVLPASERLDLQKLRAIVGDAKRTRLASEEELARDYPEFELGAIAPFGGARRDRVIVERRLAKAESLVVAGSHVQSLSLRAADLLKLTGAEVADICQD